MSAATRTEVRQDLLARILVPYKEHCRYLQRAWCEQPEDGADHLVRLVGELAIPESCYIDDTGHFNAVEFNISYNQLIYTLLGHCVERGLLADLAGMGLEEYLVRQLPDVLIHRFESRFRRPMQARAFRGQVDITETSQRRRFVLVKTTCAFEDDAGGNSLGEVSLAILQRPLSDEESARVAEATRARRSEGGA